MDFNTIITNIENIYIGDVSIKFWLMFIVFIIVALIIDFCAFKINKNVLKISIIKSIVWFISSMVFAYIIYYFKDMPSSIDFITSYILELSLSIDNMFVFVLIFRYFKINIRDQSRILIYGVFSAIILRFIMIIFGVYLINSFEFIFYIFGIVLIYSGYKMMAFSSTEEISGDDNVIVTFLQKYFNIVNNTNENDEKNQNNENNKKLSYGKFFIKKNDIRYATPLFLALIMIEKSDILFAVDSISAILSITQDLFIIFTSNIFAIIGLRSLYNILSTMIDRFNYLKYGISIILMFVGVKMMLIVHGVHIHTLISLSFIIVIFVFSCTFSNILNMIKK